MVTTIGSPVDFSANCDRVVKKTKRLKYSAEGRRFNPLAVERDARLHPGNKEVAMKMPDAVLRARIAVVSIADIKAATDAFDRGESNVFDAMDAIIAAVEAYQEAPDARREAA